MIEKARVAVGGAVYTCDVIEFSGGHWLVPQWLESPSVGKRKPAYIIRLDRLPHQRLASGLWVLTSPIPKAVMDGQPQQGFEVVANPEILLDTPEPLH